LFVVVDGPPAASIEPVHRFAPQRQA
jgi:hypothetical protein